MKRNGVSPTSLNESFGTAQQCIEGQLAANPGAVSENLNNEGSHPRCTRCAWNTQDFRGERSAGQRVSYGFEKLEPHRTPVGLIWFVLQLATEVSIRAKLIKLFHQSDGVFSFFFFRLSEYISQGNFSTVFSIHIFFFFHGTKKTGYWATISSHFEMNVFCARSLFNKD